MKLLRPLILLFGGTFGSAIFSMGAQLMLARILAVGDYGRLAAILAAVNLLSPIAGFGINWFWVQIFGREGYGGFRWIPASLALIAVMTLASVAVLVAYVLFAGSLPGDMRARAALFASAMLLGQCAVDIASAKFQLEERFGLLALWQAVPQLGRLLVAAALFFMAGASILGVLLGYGAIGALLALFGLRAIWQFHRQRLVLAGHVRTNGAAEPLQPTLAQTARQAFPFAFITVFYLVYFQSSVILLNAMLGAKETAMFSAALLVLSAIYLVPNIVFTKFLMGRICRWAEHHVASLDAAMHLSVLAMLASGIAAMLALAVIAPIAVPLLFGNRYLAVVQLLVWLSPTIPLRFVQSAYSAMLVSDANVRRRVRYAGISAGASLAVNLALLPILGLPGAVLASIISEGVLLALGIWGVHRHVDGVRVGASFRPSEWRVAFALMLRGEAARLVP